jgi:Homeodomain-like domain
MRPPSVYAKPSCPASDPCDLLRLLHGPHRVGCRLMMILLSQQALAAAEIAGLLGYDPSTVRRWIHHYQRHGATVLADQPRSGRPRLGSPRLGQRIRRLLAEPKAWTIGRLYQRLGRPAISLRTLHRRVGEVACWRRPRLVARGDPDRDQILADLQFRRGCPLGVGDRGDQPVALLIARAAGIVQAVVDDPHRSPLAVAYAIVKGQVTPRSPSPPWQSSVFCGPARTVGRGGRGTR